MITKFCFDFNAACHSGACADADHPGVMEFKLSAGARVDAGENTRHGNTKEADDSTAPGLYIALLDDEYFSYPEVSQVWGEANCTDVLRASKKSLHLDWKRVQTTAGQKITIPLVEKVRPRWWYIALVSCSGHAYELSYSAHLENRLRGWQSEFSMDTMGVFATTLCLTAVFSGLMFVQLKSLREWRSLGSKGQTAKVHPALMLLTYSTALSLGGTACWLVYYWLYMRSGEAFEKWATLARAGIVSAKTLMQIMLMLLAQGQCVCTPDIVWSEHQELVGGMVLFGVLSFCLELWGDTEFSSTTTEFVYDTRPGCALVAFDCLWLWTYSSRSLDTFRKETRPRPRRFYRLYGPLFGLWFAALPLLAGLARSVDSWVRFGVTFGVGGMVHAVALAALVHSFRPHVSEKLYELRRHEYEAINDEELDGFLKEEEDIM